MLLIPARVMVVHALAAASIAHAAECDAPPRFPLALSLADQRVELCNRDVRAARFALDAARADARIARQRPNPNLTLGANNLNPHAGVGGGPLRDKTFDSSLRLEQLVERGGKTALREAQAEAVALAAEGDLAEQARLQRLAMRNAYFDLEAAQERVRLQEEANALSAQSAQAAGRRFESGDIPRAELARMQLDAARAASELRRVEGERRRLRLDLARLIGADGYADSLEVVPSTLGAAVDARDAGRRPDVIAARRRVEAAEAAWKLARSIATRDITVGMQVDRWPVSETNTQGTGISYGFTVSVPLHVRHANEGEVARAAADLEAARAAFDRASVQAEADARLALSELNEARERLESLEKESAPLARQVAAAAEYAYQRGASGILELLDARRSLNAAQLDAAAARQEAAKAWARLEAARTTLEEP